MHTCSFQLLYHLETQNGDIFFFQVNEKLFPCKLSSEKTKLAEEAVNLAVETWGQRSLTELEAEERLSYSCEKVKL